MIFDILETLTFKIETNGVGMEIDYKGVLQVRPYAYLPFVLAIPVLGNFMKNVILPQKN